MSNASVGAPWDQHLPWRAPSVFAAQGVLRFDSITIVAMQWYLGMHGFGPQRAMANAAQQRAS
jgi:hypothetical protein